MSSPGTIVVGSGISGVACARALADAGVAVRVLDRGRRPGGRMAGRTLHGRQVDLGASYFTVPDGSPFAPVVAGLAAVYAQRTADRADPATVLREDA